jgi:hypothetical protein
MQVSDRLCAASKAVEDCVNREFALAAMARNIKEICDRPNEAVLFWLREERRVATSKTMKAVIAWKTVRDETVTTP